MIRTVGTRIYAPTAVDVVRVAHEADLTNPQARARVELLSKLRDCPGAFEDRVAYNVPGLVWAVESDMCMTGREVAPANIAYDAYGRTALSSCFASRANWARS